MVFKVECEQSLRCWECTKDCSIKDIFELPDPLFMTTLNDSFKATAGMLLASGLPFQEVERQHSKLGTCAAAKEQNVVVGGNVHNLVEQGVGLVDYSLKIF